MARYKRKNPRTGTPPKVNAHPSAPEVPPSRARYDVPSPPQIWSPGPQGISSRDMAQYQGGKTGDSMQFLQSRKTAMEKVAKNAAEKKWLEDFFSKSKLEQDMIMNRYYNDFAPALESGDGWTQAQRQSFDEWSAVTKTNLEEEAVRTNKKPRSIATSITRPQDFKDFEKARVEWNAHVNTISRFEYPDDLVKRALFVNKYKNSAEHGLVKARKAGLWTHLWDNMDNTQVLNLVKNVGRGATTDLRNVVDGLLRKQVMENRGISRTAEQAVVDKEFIDISRKHGVGNGTPLDDALKYMDDVPVYDAPTVPGGALDYPVLDHGGSFSQINNANDYENPYRYNMERTPIAALLGSSPDTNLETVITDPSRVTGGQDVVSGHPTRNLHPSAELGEYLPGGSRSVQGTSQELLELATKLGDGQITHRSLIKAMMDMGSPDLVKEIKAYGLDRQSGKTNVVALAALAVGAGLTMAILPLIPHGSRDEYLQTAISIGKSGLSALEWYDKNSSRKWDTSIREGADTLGMGDFKSAVDRTELAGKEALNKIETDSLAHLPPFVSEGQVDSGLVPEESQSYRIGDVAQGAIGVANSWASEIPGLGISAYQGVLDYYRPSTSSGVVEEQNRGLLQDNWT